MNQKCNLPVCMLNNSAMGKSSSLFFSSFCIPMDCGKKLLRCKNRWRHSPVRASKMQSHLEDVDINPGENGVIRWGNEMWHIFVF